MRVQMREGLLLDRRLLVHGSQEEKHPRLWLGDREGNNRCRIFPVLWSLQEWMVMETQDWLCRVDTILSSLIPALCNKSKL